MLYPTHQNLSFTKIKLHKSMKGGPEHVLFMVCVCFVICFWTLLDGLKFIEVSFFCLLDLAKTIDRSRPRAKKVRNPVLKKNHVQDLVQAVPSPKQAEESMK